LTRPDEPRTYDTSDGPSDDPFKGGRMTRRLLAAASAALATITSPAFAATWAIDPAHTSVQFSVRHMMVSNVRGEFGKVSGTVQGDQTAPATAIIDASIDATSINTREPKRDEHLKSPDFLDVAKYPTITFKSKRIEPAGPGSFKVTGDLTLHGVTKEVVLDVSDVTPPIKDPMGKTRAGAHATTKINRKDFGVNWSKAMDSGGVMVGDDVTITIEVEATQQ
jgi:polyisoprenoid-binding protein YceI